MALFLCIIPHYFYCTEATGVWQDIDQKWGVCMCPLGCFILYLLHLIIYLHHTFTLIPLHHVIYTSFTIQKSQESGGKVWGVLLYIYSILLFIFTIPLFHFIMLFVFPFPYRSPKSEARQEPRLRWHCAVVWCAVCGVRQAKESRVVEVVWLSVPHSVSHTTASLL